MKILENTARDLKRYGLPVAKIIPPENATMDGIIVLAQTDTSDVHLQVGEGYFFLCATNDGEVTFINEDAEELYQIVEQAKQAIAILSLA